MNTPAPELEAFYKRCNNADWTYDYSDDGQVWRAGHEAMGILKADAAKSPQHQLIFDTIYAWVWDGARGERPSLQSILGEVANAT